MKKVKKNSALITMLFLGILVFNGCEKIGGDYGAVNSSNQVFNGSTYEYLKSKPGVFDSLIFMIDRLKLKDSLDKPGANVTLFAVTNESVQQVVNKYNLARTLRKKSTVYLSTMPYEFLDSIMTRYIGRGIYTADDLNFTDGVTFKTVRYGYPMNAKLVTSNASGLLKGGPALLNFYDTRKSLFNRDWLKTTTIAINIKTSNGIVHIIEPTHPFGFGDYTKPKTEFFDNSIFRLNASAPELPIDKDGTVLIEAEDYDLGGQNIAYYDDPNSNGQRNYRSTEMVDIDVFDVGKGKTDEGGTYGDSYSLGWTRAGEWTNYSVYAPVAGRYKIIARVANGNNLASLKFHFDLDLKNVTGSLSFVSPRDWKNWQSVVSPEFDVTQGNHVIRFYHETWDVQFNNFVIKRVSN